MKKTKPMSGVATTQIKVLLAEDNVSFRKSLRLLIESDGDIEVVGEAKNGLEAVRMAASLHPDVIVMDIAMPLLNGLQATRQIRERASAPKVLILSAHPDPEYIQQATILGASGYLIKQSSTQFLAHAVQEIMKGRAYFSASISKRLRDQCQKVFDKGESPKRNVLGLAIPA